MRAAIVNALGQAPVFGNIDEPVAREGETVIAVSVAGIKQLDRAIVAGTHYSSPKILPRRTVNGSILPPSANRTARWQNVASPPGRYRCRKAWMMLPPPR